MSNRPLRRAALALAAGLLASAPVQAQEDRFAAIEIKTQKVAEGIYMLTGEGGNIGVSVGADGVFMIDDQFAPLSEKIKAAVAALSDQPIRFLINTHWHYDHTGGNELLAGEGGGHRRAPQCSQAHVGGHGNRRFWKRGPGLPQGRVAGADLQRQPDPAPERR